MGQPKGQSKGRPNAQAQLEEQDHPDPVEMARIYAEVAQRASRIINTTIQKQSHKGAMPELKDELGVARAFMDLSARLLADPYKLAQANMSMMWDYISLWQGSVLRVLGVQAQPTITPPKGDSRFRDDAWENRFLFDFIKQSYLIASRYLHNVVSNVDELDDATQQKVSFFTRQYVDAFSPSNFILTNPQVLQETISSHGRNLVKGLNNLLRDMEKGDGQLRVSMTDTSAFELGKNVATTPGKVVFQNDLFQLIQYAPTTEKVYKRPFLIVSPWINKYYILDLREKNSFIKWVTDQGHSTFIMSWINPDERLSHKSYEDYLFEGALEALNQVEKITGESSINTGAYCLGGTLLMTLLAWLTNKGDHRVASATFFTTMLDFSEPGELGVFVNEDSVKELERSMEERGYMDGSEMASAFNMLRANDLIWSFVINNYLLGKDPFPFDLLYWNSDSTRMPSTMHGYYLRNMYLENRLCRPGGLELGKESIDIRKVKTPCYFASTAEDHIAPWKSTYMGALLPSGKVRFVLGGSGHIAGIINPPAANKYCYWINESLPGEAEEYLAGATQYPGSWWPDWQSWVSGLPDADVMAEPRKPGKGAKIIEDAPGSYATFRLDAQKAEPQQAKQSVT